MKSMTTNLKISNNSLHYLNLNKAQLGKKLNNSPLAISLAASKEIKAKNVYLVGFDGYEKIDKINDYSLYKENQLIFDFYRKKLNLVFLTDTTYENIDKSSIYKYLN